MTFMKCGHIAIAIDDKGRPVCPICFGLHPGAEVVEDDRPSLEGRQALCVYKFGRKGQQHSPVPSSWDLPFFEYCGPGSPAAEEYCKCGYHESAHGKCADACDKFEPQGPLPYDRYYCGCWG